MADVTVIATAAITGFVGFSAAWLQSRSGAHLARLQNVELRRDERKHAYLAVMDLLVELGWRQDDPTYDVVRDFNLPFLHATNLIRVHGSPEAVAAIDTIQRAFARRKVATTEADAAEADRLFAEGHDQLVIAARQDVGPRAEDNLPDVAFRQGAGRFADEP
jgi:hypothetical protein